MSRTYKSPGEVLTLTAPSGGVVSGTPALIGKLLVVPEVTAAVGDSFAARVGAVQELPKTAAQAWAEGDEIFYDSATAKLDNTGAIGVPVGVAAEVAANPSSTGVVRLHGLANPRARIHPSSTVAAAGSAQGDAGQLLDGFNLVSAADGTKGVILPVAARGMIVKIKNNVNAVLKVYPKTGGTINAIAANGAISMAALTAAEFVSYDGAAWYTIPLVPS